MEKKNHQFLNGKMFYYLYCHDQFFYCKNDMETIEFQSRNPQASQHRYTASDRRQQRVSRPYPLLPDWSNAHICPYHFVHYICRCLHPLVLIGRFSRHLHQLSNLYKSSESHMYVGKNHFIHFYLRGSSDISESTLRLTTPLTCICLVYISFTLTNRSYPHNTSM